MLHYARAVLFFNTILARLLPEILGGSIPFRICAPFFIDRFRAPVQSYTEVFAIDYFLQSGELFFRPEVDQGHALRGATHLTNLRDPHTNQHTPGGNQHDFVAAVHERGGDDIAITGTGLNRDHSL